jgi:hypothetical protein
LFSFSLQEYKVFFFWVQQHFCTKVIAICFKDLFGSANLISTFTANNVLRVHKMLRKQILGLFLVSISWFVLAGSFLSYTYQQTTIETMPGVVLDGVQINQPLYNETITTPYKEYTLPLIMFSVALFFAGFALYFLRFKD